MIRAKLKSIEIADVPNLDPAKFVPDDFEDFSCTFTLRIGTANEDGEDLFNLTVCSPKWLARAVQQDGFIWGRHDLIVPEYNLMAITAILTKFVGSVAQRVLLGTVKADQ
jgi:hypothetical protein